MKDGDNAEEEEEGEGEAEQGGRESWAYSPWRCSSHLRGLSAQVCLQSGKE